MQDRREHRVRGGSSNEEADGTATENRRERQQWRRQRRRRGGQCGDTGGICKSCFSTVFHSRLLFLIRSSYYSDLLFLFTDYRKRKSVAATEEVASGKEATRERISVDTVEAERRFERR